jgi:tetratricopeptide (TPR) repeat protein
MPQGSRVFISYASENVAQVRRLYEDLKKRNVKAWFDKEDLKFGKWKPQITKAIAQSNYFLFCLSEAAIKKIGDEPGFQDVELNTAFEIALAQSEQTFTIVPVRLEDVDRGGNRLSIFQQYDLFNDWEGTLDELAILFGGTPLKSNSEVVEELTDEQKILGALYGKAHALYLSRQPERSLEIVKAIEVYEGETVSNLVNKGAALHALGRFQEALTAFDKAISLLTDKVGIIPSKLYVIWWNRGKALTDLGRFDDALASFDKALSIKADEKVWLDKARVFSMLDESSKREFHALDMALSINPDFENALAFKGISLYMLGRYSEALSALDKAISIKSDFPLAHEWRGDTLFKLNRFEEAIKESDIALANEPRNVAALKNKGASLIRLHRYNEALDVYNLILSFKPGHVLALYGKGASLGGLERYGEALEAFNTALQYDPNYEPAKEMVMMITNYLSQL